MAEKKKPAGVKTASKAKKLALIPNYNSQQLCKALVRLGFQKKKSNNHQHKFKHPTRKPNWGGKACVVFPDDIGKRKILQQVVVKQIAANFGFELIEVIEAIK